MPPKSVAEIGVATHQEYEVTTIVCTDDSQDNAWYILNGYSR